jgi:hypothetical protein
MATATGEGRPPGEAELMSRLITAAHETIEGRLSPAEVDSILGVRHSSETA